MSYISSLIEDDDAQDLGLFIGKDGNKIFYGDVAVKTAIVFADGTIQKSAGVALPDVIDCGTF